MELFHVDLAHEAFYLGNTEGLEDSLNSSQRADLHSITDKIEILVMDTGYVPTNLFKITPNLREVWVVQLPNWNEKHLSSFRELVSIGKPKTTNGSAKDGIGIAQGLSRANTGIREVCITKKAITTAFKGYSRQEYELRLESLQQRVLECRQSTIKKCGYAYGKKFEGFQVYAIRGNR